MTGLITVTETLALLASPSVAKAQAPAAAGPTQDISSMDSGSNPVNTPNSLPAGSMNAVTGPQAHPAYPSGSSTPNPGAAFVKSQTAVPAAGQTRGSPGDLSTTTVGSDGTETSSSGPGVGESATPPPASK